MCILVQENVITLTSCDLVIKWESEPKNDAGEAILKARKLGATFHMDEFAMMSATCRKSGGSENLACLLPAGSVRHRISFAFLKEPVICLVQRMQPLDRHPVRVVSVEISCFLENRCPFEKPIDIVFVAESS